MKKKKYLRQTDMPELAKKVLKQIGLPFKEVWEHVEDFRDAGVGVSGFIYYSDTVKFAKKNSYLIMAALLEFENELGEPLNKPVDGEQQYFNWLAWFALEHVIQDIMYLKES